MSTNQNSLDTILDELYAFGFQDGLSETTDHPQLHQKEAKKKLLSWHHQQTTKDMLALIGEDEPVETIEAVGDGIFHTPKGEVSHGRNLLRTELRKAILARKKQ